MSKRGRTAGFMMSNDHRAKIANSQILKRLMDHAEGRIEMTSTQVDAAKTLLKKVMPDLQSVALTDAEHTGPAKIEIGWIKD